MLLFLLACAQPTEKPDEVIPSLDDTGDTATDTADTVPEDLGDPYLAMVAAVSPGILQDTCTLRIDVFLDGEAAGGEQISATGGEWVGLQLTDAQYTASAVYQDCTELDPSGSFDSGVFSGVAGNLFLFWYNGANGGYTTLTQTRDFNGGLATVTVAAGADMTGLQTIAAELGVTLTNLSGDDWQATFPTDLPVGQVLAAFSRDDAFVEGSPDWIDAPYWW
jgi:hypothetical protein